MGNRYIISDIHAMLSELKSLIAQILIDDPKPDLFCFVGDFADRGYDSKGVVDFILELKEKYPVVALVGNHCNIVNWFFNSKVAFGNDITDGPFKLLRWWLPQGFAQTLDSYGIEYKDWASKPWAVMQRIREQVPESHREFYKSLQLFYRDDDIFVCHAWWATGHKLPQYGDILEKETEECMLWNRYSPEEVANGIKSELWGDTVVIHGHTPTSYYFDNSFEPMEVITSGQVRLIDCGSFVPAPLGRISAYCPDNQKIYYSES